MGTLTDALPKPMLSVNGRTLLEHKFDILGPDFHEVVVVIGYQGDVIRAAYGDSYKGMNVRYVEQKQLDGTMGALALAAPHLSERFVVMMGDDIYGQEDLVQMLMAGDWAMLVEQTDHMAAGGRIVTENGEVVTIEEGDHRGTRGLMNTNMFVLDPRIFGYPMIPKAAGSTEYGLPQTVLAASKESGIALHAVHASHWVQITAPEDIARAEGLLKIEDTASSV
jgi:UDP-N-acetylglucosamine diphosphorylase / glucose-1-phosphate thymidylyltransferase / UDP-N-acetylgalactosamine diphosphorylase / glucosamine-1-phosphate N-acetyltransferase / galactosamine-1-phosphate N-acetyltransferase